MAAADSSSFASSIGVEDEMKEEEDVATAVVAGVVTGSSGHVDHSTCRGDSFFLTT